MSLNLAPTPRLPCSLYRKIRFLTFIKKERPRVRKEREVPTMDVMDILYDGRDPCLKLSTFKPWQDDQHGIHPTRESVQSCTVHAAKP